VNQRIKQALASAEIPSRLEPMSLTSADGNRPDRMITMAWNHGKCLVWDFACSHTLSSSSLNKAALEPGEIACEADKRKTPKYTNLQHLYTFIPFAVETLGAPASEASALFEEIGRLVRAVTFEPRSCSFLMQRLSVANRRGNAECVTGSVPPSAHWEQLFYI
jgi:hypothetical protein